MNRYLLSQPAAHIAQTLHMIETHNTYYSTNMRLCVEFWVEEHSEITDNMGLWYNVVSDKNVLVDKRDFPEVCCTPKPHHLCFLGVQLKALRRAPVFHRLHTSSKPSSDVTNIGRLAVLDALLCMSSANRCWWTRCCSKTFCVDVGVSADLMISILN